MLSDENSKSSAAVKSTLKEAAQGEKGRIGSRLHKGKIVVSHPSHDSSDGFVVVESGSLTTWGMNKLHEGIVTPRSSINLPGNGH